MSMANGCRIIMAIVAIVALSACDIDGDDSHKINGSVHVPAGKAPGDARTVNGAIRIDDGATVNSAVTVNGSIHLGDHATATSLKTVNGSITLGAGAHDSGSAVSVNGDLTLAEGAEISGSLTNVNGRISLTAAHVAGGIRTANGDIRIMGASRVEGGIVVEKSNSLGLGEEEPVIVIGPGAAVQGELRFERPVKLYVSEKATIGTVTGATPVPFTGDTPPK
ncbi:MAG TPA: hypothetical protein VGI65_10170 [Steroidobacteraceae bacterium]